MKASGTSAKLKPNDVITIQELLYALILPSGNDAAVVLCYTIGQLIYDFYNKSNKVFNNKCLL